jgi:integrase/recombinase XerD
MKLDETLKHYLIDVDNNRGHLTFLAYEQRLGVLLRLLATICKDQDGKSVSIVDLEQVTTLHLRQCVQHLLTTPIDLATHKGRKPEYGELLAASTVRAYIRVWKSFFSWCHEEELIDVNPAARLKHPKVPKRIRPAFITENIEKMLSVCDTSTNDGFRDKAILLLLLDTGLRIAEISSLKVFNVHDKYIKVEGKGRKEREVGIHPEMSKFLWKYIHKYRQPTDGTETVLFIGHRGKPLRGSGVHYIIKRIQKACGLEDIKFSAHVFRHTFAKMYLKRGGDLFKLSRQLGHGDINTTKIYLEDFSSTDAREEHDNFSPLAGIDIRKRSKRKKQTDE